MQINDLRREYLKRYRTYTKGNLKKVVKKAYKQLRNGEEIRWEHIKKFGNGHNTVKMEDFLIALPQIEDIKETLIDKLDNIRDFDEKDIQVIYGEYGEGKTQTSQLILEWFSDKQRFPRTIPIFQSLTTMPKFFWEISKKVHQHLEGKPALGDIKAQLDSLSFGQLDSRFFNHPSGDQINLLRLIEDFNNLILRLSQLGYNLILILDEFDRVLTNIEEWKPWGDLFTSLRGNMKLLITILLPQALSEKIVVHDARMKRWKTHFNINAKFLSGSIEDRVQHFVANVVALSAANYNHNIDNDYLELVSLCVENQIDRLKRQKIRSLNLWAVNLSEIIQKLIDKKFLKRVKRFKKKYFQQRGQTLEKKARTFLRYTHLPDLKHQIDEDQIDIYKFHYKSENLQHPNGKLSDGQIIMEKIKNDQSVREQKVAIEIKFTTKNQHSTEEVEKIQDLSEYWPTVFISMGTSEQFRKQFTRKVNSWQKCSTVKKPNYPVLLIQIPEELYHFLLVVNGEKEVDYRKISGIMRFWAKSIVNFLPKLHNFLHKLPDALSDREVRIRFQKLETIEASMSENVNSNPYPQLHGTRNQPVGQNAQGLEKYGTPNQNIKDEPTSNVYTPPKGSVIQAAQSESRKRGTYTQKGGQYGTKGTMNNQRGKSKEFSKHLCSFIDGKIGSYKTIRVFKRDLKKRISKEVPSLVANFEGILDKKLNVLEQDKLVLRGKRGSMDVIYKKDAWDMEKAFKMLITET